MEPVYATLFILAAAVIAFMTNRIPLGVVSIGVALALFFTGVLTLPEALAGFGDQTVIFIAAMFVVSESLDASGVTNWVGQQVIGRAGTKRNILLLVISLLVAGLTALISVNGAVAALLPIVIVIAARTGIQSSQLLIPLAFAAHAGSMLLLTGTPVNIIVSEAAAESGGRPFGYFEFALVGIPLVIGTLVIMLLFGKRLLPNRSGAIMPLNLADYARTLRQQYALSDDTGTLMGIERGITEVVVPPRSSLIGSTFAAGMATPSGDLILLAATRAGESIGEDEFTAQAGDILLLQGTWEDLDRHTSTGRVLPVNRPTTLRREVPLGVGAKRSLVILAIMIVFLATGVVPPAVAALLAAAALVLTKTVTPTRAYQSISWTTVVLIAGMIPLATAFFQTGTAELVADRILEFSGNSSPYTALLILAVLTVIFGQFISNTATVLILVPVAISLAETLNLSVQPFMMALTVAGAASFLTPIATPANLLVMKPGGYRFGDYWKLGLPLAILFVLVAVYYVPLIWPF